MAATSAGALALVLSSAVATGAGAARNYTRNQASGARTRLRNAAANANKPPDLPGIDDEAVKQARGLKLQQLRQRSGSASTDLTGGNRLGG